MDDLKENFFNVHLCHVCKSKESFNHSKLCSACKLISYCSKEHQKADRANHKNICQAAQRICQETRKDDVFDAGITGLLFRQEMSVLMRGISHPDFPPKSERTKVKVGVSKMIGKCLTRPMKRFEANMIFFPKCCAVCFSRKNIEKELVCTNCFGVAYCSEQHQRFDNHKEVCSEFQRVLDMDLFLLNVNESPEIPKLKADQVTDMKLDAYDMKSFIAEYIKPGMKVEEEAFNSIYYSNVLTFAYTIKRIPNFKLGEKLVIHVVGAHVAYEGRVIEYWEYLLHLFSSIHTVTLILIGPCVSGPPTKLKLCDNCCNAGKSIEVLYYEERYHEYHRYSCPIIKPDVIIAFSSGLYDHDLGYDPWGQTLPLFFKYDNVPIILTEAYKYEAEKDLERLLSLDILRGKKVRVLVKCEKNPFKNLKPWRDLDEPDYTVKIKDSYVSALIVESG